jgi:hypothetical protein
MKVTVSKISITIDMDPDAKGTSIDTIDEIMRQISKQTGRKWTAGRVGGYWIIQVDGRGVFDGHAQPSGRKFTMALANAMNLTVCTLVPMKGDE